MSFNFSEALTIELPKLGEAYDSNKESVADIGLVVEIAAIHEGLTANYNMYSAKELQDSLDTWVNPYPRPVITNHNVENEALGRIMAAKIAQDNDLTTIMLQAAISDQAAIEKYRDKRYLTGSVGGKADQAICSICEADWAKPFSYELPCEHRRGTVYKGKLAWLEMRGINWKEYSMVNTPADATSGVRSATGSSEQDGEWVRAEVFAVNMNKESIISFGESGSTDILVGKKKREAIPLYHNTRGAFLSAFATTEKDEETKVSDEKNDDDILLVTEGLSDALAEDITPVDEDVVDEDVVDEDVVTDTDAVDEGDEEVSDEVVADDKEEDEPVADATDDAPAEDSNESLEEKEAEEPVEEVVDSVEDEAPEESDTDAELVENYQERISGLEDEVSALTEENTKLRGALKKGLAERVVDAKIDLGHESAEDRSELINEHVKRSAGSLADSLIDLRKAPRASEAGDLTELFDKKSGSKVVKEDQKVTTDMTDTKDDRKSFAPSEILENIAVDGLMGRRAL